MSESFVSYDSELTWVALYGPDEKVVGRAGVHQSLITGELIHVDGHALAWTTPVIVMHGEIIGIKFDGEKTIRSPEPMMLLSIPDYPRENAATYLLGLTDAEELARRILSQCAEAKRALSPLHRRIVRERNEAAKKLGRKAAFDATRCVEDGCLKDRKFFDEAGNGYCKKHADDRGLRPHGKVS